MVNAKYFLHFPVLAGMSFPPQAGSLWDFELPFCSGGRADRQNMENDAVQENFWKIFLSFPIKCGDVLIPRFMFTQFYLHFPFFSSSCCVWGWLLLEHIPGLRHFFIHTKKGKKKSPFFSTKGRGVAAHSGFDKAEVVETSPGWLELLLGSSCGGKSAVEH